MKEMKRQGLLDGDVPPLGDVLKVVPTALDPILRSCEEYDAVLLEKDAAKSIVEVFSINDAGNNAGKKITCFIFVGYDHVNDCVWERVYSAEAVAGGGKKTAEYVLEHLKEIGDIKCAGSATDNASDVIKTFVAAMKVEFPDFVEVGCTLHILNLILMNSYHSTFGFEQMGVPSALRVGFIINYLMGLDGHFDQFEIWAKDPEGGNCPAIAFMACGASKGRWWSVVKAFGDVYRNRVKYSEWCLYMAAGANTTSTYIHIFEEAAAWLKNKKVICDLAFVLAFHVAWWDDEMLFCQGVGPWQENVPAADKKAGYRADEYSAHVVLMRRRLVEMDVEKDGKFATWREHRDQLDDTPGENGEKSERAFMNEQAAHFLSTALQVQGNHHQRWLVDLVDCSLAHPNPEVALAMGAALLSIYDGGDLPELGAATMVTVEGDEVGLCELVKSMTQFVTCDDLHEKTVMFPDEETAEDIRTWVGNSGSFVGASGARLQRKLNTRVRGRPIHSHVAERMVNLGNNLTRKYASHESEDRISGKVAAVANGTRVDARAAAYEYEEAHKEEVAMQARLNATPVHWRDKQTGQKRGARAPGQRWRNKEVFGRAVVRAAKRAERVTAEVAAEARSKAEAREGVKGRTEKRKDE